MLICPLCKKEFTDKPSRLKLRKFCSRLCQNRTQAKNNKPGAAHPLYKHGDSHYRKYISLEKCSICNKLSSELTSRIEVHHKDHNRLNNLPSNLQAVCSKCHHGVIHKKTHCKWGHPFDDENTWHDLKRGSRQCRKCHKLRNLKNKSLFL